MTLDDLCTAGNLADEHLANEKFDEAEKAYTDLLSQMIDDGEIDGFILAKLTLGLLLSTLRQGNIEAAHEIWSAEDEDDAFALGIQCLENGQTSDHDFAVYLFVSALLHSLGTEPDAAEEAVNHYMGLLCKYADAEDPELLPTALNNWRLHIEEIYEDRDVPSEAYDELSRCAKLLTTPVPESPIELPLPGPWEVAPAEEDDESNEDDEGDEGNEGTT